MQIGDILLGYINSETVLDWLKKEPFTLTLGSGFFGFFAHLGVLKALLESGVAPARLTGASSGALVASCYATGMSLSEIENLLFSLTREDFWDPGFGLGLLKGEKFRVRMRAAIPAARFEELATPLALSVFNTSSKTTEVWEHGDLIDAVYASCALPLLFQPLQRHGVRYADGGIKDRAALAGVGPHERVLIHHLSARSPWRRASDPALRPPERMNGTTLVIDGLTRVGPCKLPMGPKAFSEAYEATKSLLRQTKISVMHTSLS